MRLWHMVDILWIFIEIKIKIFNFSHPVKFKEWCPNFHWNIQVWRTLWLHINTYLICSLINSLWWAQLFLDNLPNIHISFQGSRECSNFPRVLVLLSLETVALCASRRVYRVDAEENIDVNVMIEYMPVFLHFLIFWHTFEPTEKHQNDRFNYFTCFLISLSFLLGISLHIHNLYVLVKVLIFSFFFMTVASFPFLFLDTKA